MIALLGYLVFSLVNFGLIVFGVLETGGACVAPSI